MQGLRELEFDHEMGKLDELDYRDLKRALEDRALAAMSARAANRAASVRLAPRRAKAEQPAAHRSNFCQQCGVPAAGCNFCAECGAELNLEMHSAAQARVRSRTE